MYDSTVSKQKYQRNHILSQCLLERFQDAEGNLSRYDIKRGKVKPTKPGLDGFVRGLWTHTSAEFMETLWNQEAENNIHKVFAKIDKQQKLKRRDVELLAKFCALHFVRSKEFMKLYEGIRQRHAATEAINGFAGQYIVRLKLLKQTEIPC